MPTTVQVTSSLLFLHGPARRIEVTLVKVITYEKFFSF